MIARIASYVQKCHVSALLSFLIVLVGLSLGIDAQAQTDWPCPTCEGRSFEPDTAYAPYQTSILYYDCPIQISWRIVHCTDEPANCPTIYLEKIEFLQGCCSLDQIRRTVPQVVNDVSALILIKYKNLFGIADCGTVYRKTCWSTGTGNSPIVPCAVDECCSVSLAGGVLTWNSSSGTDTTCALLPGCVFVCP